jgi:hypothetical protein
MAAAYYNLALLTFLTGDRRTAYESRHKLEALDQNLADRLASVMTNAFVHDIKHYAE